MPARATRRSLLLLAAVVAAAAAATQGVAWWQRATLGREVAERARPGDIHMIASVTCPYCAAARAWFDANGVSFTECLIERDPVCAAKYQALMAPGTPVFLVRGERLVGFDPQAIAVRLAPRESSSSRLAPRES